MQLLYSGRTVPKKAAGMNKSVKLNVGQEQSRFNKAEG